MLNYRMILSTEASTCSPRIYSCLKMYSCSILFIYLFNSTLSLLRSVRMAERLALPTSDHGVAGSNPARGEILPEPKRCFIAQSLSCSPFHRLEMTEILLKGRKTLTHPSILSLLTMLASHLTYLFIVIVIFAYI